MMKERRISELVQQDVDIAHQEVDLAGINHANDNTDSPIFSPFTTLHIDSQIQSPQQLHNNRIALSNTNRSYSIVQEYKLWKENKEGLHLAETVSPTFGNTDVKEISDITLHIASTLTSISLQKNNNLGKNAFEQQSKTVLKKNNAEISTFFNLTSRSQSDKSQETPQEKVANLKDMKLIQANISQKYLIYLCDHTVYCYGLGDRQRGIVGVYMLAVVTGRKFGVIMTSPSNLTEFYKPNMVNWKIEASELKGRSFIEIDVLGPKVDLHLDKIDFNAEYPQDVVYIRTNQKLYYETLRNPLYISKFPKWAHVHQWRLFQVAWLRLMTPTQSLRQELNTVLLHIVKDMKSEFNAWKQLSNTGCCTRKTLCNGIQCPNSFSLDISETNDQIFSQNRCVNILKLKFAGRFESTQFENYANNFCKDTLSVIEPRISEDTISRLQGYDVVDMNMVCAHIRLGRSKTFPFETVTRNKEGAETAVWRFLQPFLNRGHHVYLATDSDEVRVQAKALFGNRIHVSTQPIVHIALVQDGQNKRQGFRLTLMEQLLLTTSCKVLMVSYSGFSMKAAQLRQEIQRYDHSLFMYQNGSVFGKSVHWLP